MNENVSLQNLSTKSLRDQVFDQMISQITKGVWKPGDKLPSESELSSMLGVSRMSVREAMQKLVAIDLVETHRGKGSYIKEFTTNNYLKSLTPMILLSRDDILNIIEYRRILEIGIIDLFVKRCEPSDIEILKTILQQMKRYKNNLKKFTLYDLDFHLKLYQMTRNPVLIKISNMISDIVNTAMNDVVTGHGAEEGIVIHEKIVHALETNNAELIKKVTTDLFDKIEKDLNKTQEKEKNNERN